jgi:hypothetical protein
MHGYLKLEEDKSLWAIPIDQNGDIILGCGENQKSEKELN